MQIQGERYFDTDYEIILLNFILIWIYNLIQNVMRLTQSYLISTLCVTSAICGNHDNFATKH